MSSLLNNLYYTGSTLTAFLGDPASGEQSNRSIYNNVDLIVCSSLQQIIVLNKDDQSLVVTYPTLVSSLYYIPPPPDQATILTQVTQVVADQTSNLAYNYYSNDDNAIFRIDRYGTQGQNTATASISVPSVFYSQSFVQFIKNNEQGNSQTFIIFQNASSSLPDTLIPVPGNVGSYYYNTGSNITESVQNLAQTINKALSGSLASSSYDLLYATSSGANLILSASTSGSFANSYNFIFNTVFGDSYSQSLSGGTDIRTLSGTSSVLLISQSANNYVEINANDDYYFVYLSGSGKYFEASLEVIDTVTNETFYFSSSEDGTQLSTTLTSSYGTTYTINATTNYLPWIKLGYRTTASFQVSGSDSGSLDAWNSYFYVSASKLVVTGSDVYLIGGDVGAITAFSNPSSTYSDFQAFGQTSLQTCSLQRDTTQPSSSLLYFPNLEPSSSLTYLDLNYHNELTSSIPEVSSILNVQHLDCSLNALVGNAPSIPADSDLQYFDCSYNNMSGSLGSINNAIALTKYCCNNNHFTGSMPSLLSTISLLEYFDCSTNKLTGSISELPYQIKYFNCSKNMLTGSIPDLSNSPFLEYFNCSENKLSGSMASSFLNNLNLDYFNCFNSGLSGSIPQISHLEQLNTFDCSYNRLSGSFPDLPVNISTFDCSNNAISGSLPSMSNCPNLSYFDCSYNKLTGAPPEISSNSQLTYISFRDNQFTGSMQDLSNNPLLYEYVARNSGLTGSISSLSNNLYLTHFICSFNSLTGNLPSLSNNQYLQLFDANNCQLTGVIPPLYSNFELVYFNVGANNLSGSLPDLSNNTKLLYFNANDNNYITGSIPNLSNNVVLTQFYCANNQLDSYTSSSVSPTLLNFEAYNNQLNVSAVDGILVDLDNAGGLNGIVQLQGGSNAAPSAVGYAATASLESKGWYVSVN